MAKLILQHDDGTSVIVRDNLPEDVQASDILVRSEFIAAKLWMEEDVREYLLGNGYSDCEENVAEVLNTGILNDLEDCTDSDWEYFNLAVHTVEGKLKVNSVHGREAK